MRKILLPTLLLILCSFSFAQKLDWVVELKTGDNAYENVPLSISDGDDGAYLWATANEELEFSSASGSVQSLERSEQGSRGYNIVRVNANGEKIFSTYVNVTIGGDNGFLNTTSLVTDTQNNLFVLGHIGSATTISIGGIDIDVVQDAHQFNHAIILKISPQGELISYKLLQKDKEFVTYFLSADFFNDKLYVLYGLIDQDVDAGGGEFLFTHYVDVFDTQWNILQQKSFSGKTLNTGGGIEARKAFLMSKIIVHDNNNVYLSGLIKNGQGSDLSDDIITEENLSVSSIIKLDANLDFMWFRGVQGGVGNRYNTSMATLPHGDIVFNSANSSYSESRPISLVGNNIEKTEFPIQNERSTVQVFLSSNGGLKFQSQINSTIIEQNFFLVGSDIYFPFYLNTKDQVNFYYDDAEVLLKSESDDSSFIYGFVKFNQFGRYQSHRFYELTGQWAAISDMQILPKTDCNSFLFLGRYGGDGESSVSVNFQDDSANPLINDNNTGDTFLASYSNQTPSLEIDESLVYRSGNTISIPVSITDDSKGEVTFFASSSNESIISTDNYELVVDSAGSRLVFEQTSGATGMVELQLQLVDQCESTDEFTIALILEDINDVPVFTSKPITSVDDNNLYEYEIQISDTNSDEVTIIGDIIPDWASLEEVKKASVSTIAGNGNADYLDGLTSEASFKNPTGVTVDSEGHIYVADAGNFRIRKISTQGEVITIAGNGSQAFLDGPALEASLAEIRGLEFDQNGTLYFIANNRLRKIDENGNVVTVAGSGAQGFSDGQGVEAVFDVPQGMAIDLEGNIFLADMQNYRIRKVTPDGVVSTFAGSGEASSEDGTGEQASFNLPKGLDFDSQGNLIVSEVVGGVVRKITPNGEVTTLAGSGQIGSSDGQGVSASFFLPGYLSVDKANDNVYLSDFGNTIRQISSNGEVTTLVGSGEEGFLNAVGTDSKIHDPRGSVIDKNGDLIFVDFNQRVRKVYLTKKYKMRGTADPADGLVDVTLQANDGKGGVTTQSFTIKVDNQSPVFNSPEDYQRSENHLITNPAYSVGVQDESEVTYSLGTDHDEALFNMNGQYINSVYFNESPDFETPQDTDGDNVYVFEIIATDKGGNSSSLLVNLTITNTNESDPVISTNANLSIDENTTQITLIEATGFEGDFDLSFSKSGGMDLDAFFMTTDGELSFRNAPDYEFPTDSDGDNVYHIEITAHVGERTSSKLFSITVNDVFENDPPEFISNPITQINDNETYTYKVETEDADGDVLNLRATELPDWLTFNSTPYGEVSTFAGTVPSTLKDGVGAEASYNNPEGIAFDKEGNLYIADVGNNRVVKITPSGEATTYVGTGVAGSLDGKRESALLNKPYDVAFDSDGNLFISDHGNSSIRKVDLEGNVTTIYTFERAFSTNASTPASTLGDSELIRNILVTSQGEIIVASNELIRVISPSGNIDFLTDQNDNRLVSKNAGIALDADDNIYFNDTQNQQVKRRTPEGVVSVFAGAGDAGFLDGSASEAKFESLSGLAYHPNGGLVVSDGFFRIRKIDDQGNVSTLVNDVRDFSSAVTLDVGVNSDGQVIALDFLQAKVFMVTESGSLDFFSGGYDRSPKNGPKETSTFLNPNDAIQDSKGNIFVSENHRIRKIDTNGIVTTFAGSVFGYQDGVGAAAMFHTPSGLAIDQADNIYVADFGNHVIRKIEPDGTVSTVAGNTTRGFQDGEAQNAQFNLPEDLVLDDEGNIYVADYGNHRIRKINSDGTVTTIAGNGLQAIDENDLNDPVVTFPRSITRDGEGTLYFTSARSLIRKVNGDGSLTTIAGNVSGVGLMDGNGTAAKFQNPVGLTTDISGNIYVADNEFNSIRKISPEGTVTTLAGTESPGLEDKPRNQAKFTKPSGLMINSEGDLIVVDHGNHRLRKVSLGNSVLSGSAVGESGIHQVSLELTDESGATATQSFSIEVIDVTPPKITSEPEISTEENISESFFMIEATDSNDLKYSLGQDKDESFFIIDELSGELSFRSPPNFESPEDSNNDNVYEVLVIASDGSNTSEQSISITVEDVDEVNPIISLVSSVQGLVLSPTVSVNVELSEEVIGLSAQSFTVTNATISDFQGSGLEYSFVLNSEMDGPASVRVLENMVFDASENGNEASDILTFNFEARNVAPSGVIFSASAISENISERVEVAMLSAEDGDESDQHTFRLVSGEGDVDNSKFEIVGNKLFKKRGISFDYEKKPTYSIRVQVADIRGGIYSAVQVIEVIDVPEPSISLKIVDATERELEVSGVNFGRVRVGNTNVRKLELENTSSDSQLEVSEINLTTGFIASESSFIVGLGEKKTIDITFAPEQVGVNLGKLEVISNAGNRSLSLAGTAFANKKPIAIAPEARINHVSGNIMKLIGFDPDGDEVEFVITSNPTLGDLEAQSGSGEYKFIPSDLAPETVYEDELKFKVVETNGGLSSEEATLKFRFKIKDVKHSLLPTEIVQVDEDNLNLTVRFDDEVINNEYFLTGFYRGKEEGQTVFFANSLRITKQELTNDGHLSAIVAVNRDDYPALFTNSKLLLGVKLKTANGFESSNMRIFSRSSEGQLGGNTSSDSSTDDGDFSVFALDSSVPENETVSLNISAVEFGDFDLNGATLEIIKSPSIGIVSTPILVSNESGLAQWSIDYTSTSEIGLEDSFEFRVFHPEREETITSTVKIDVIEVPDAPELASIANQQMNEDGELSFEIEATDLDSDLNFLVVSSEADVKGTVSDGKLNLVATNDYYGLLNIQLIATEAIDSDPQSVSQSFSLTVLPINDAPVVIPIEDQTLDEDDQISITLAATDADADASVFSYSVISNDDDNVEYTVQNGVLTITPKADFNGEVSFTVKANDGTETATAVSEGEEFNLMVIPINDAPEVYKSVSTQTLIEGFVSYSLDLAKFFTDKETISSELTYSISGITNVSTSVSGSILTVSSISGNTGLQVGQLNASDGEYTASQTITFVTSTPSSEITVANALSDLNVDEDFAEQRIDLSDVFAYSTDANAEFVYSLAGVQNLNAIVEGQELVILSSENFNGSESVYITASVDGKANLTSFTINVAPVNDAPELVTIQSDQQVLEDAAFELTIPSTRFIDVDNDALTLSATFNKDWLTFNTSTNTFSGTPENGDVGTLEVTLTATDPLGATVSDVFTITVENTNDAPSNISLTSSALNENTDAGTVITELSSSDVDVNNTEFSYSLVSGEGDDDNSAFAIIENTLTTVADFDFESKSSYSIRVRTDDGFEGTFEKVFTISVNNVNEVATDIGLNTTSLEENLAVGTAIDALTTTDEDASDTHTYTLVPGEGDTDNDSFEIVDGELVSKAQFNFEEKSSYSVRVETTDAGGLTFEKSFTINITDANDEPTAISTTTLELPENEAIGTVIGQFSSTDEDTNDEHTYSLVSGEGDTDNDSFEFEGRNLKAKASFNFETKSSYSIRVQSSDGNGGTVESQFTVNVTNVLEVELRTESSVTAPAIGIGETETVDLVLNNDGEDALEITDITFPEGYSGSFTETSIAGGSNQALTITFAPTEAKVYSGDISIESNAGTSTIAITGEGQIVAGLEDDRITARLIKVYPNPAVRFVEIDLTDLNGTAADLSIATISGNSVWSKPQVREKKVRVDVSDYSQGTYLILISTERGSTVKKLLIRK